MLKNFVSVSFSARVSGPYGPFEILAPAEVIVGSLQNPKLPPGCPKMADKGYYPSLLVAPNNFCYIGFFSASSIRITARKIQNGCEGALN